jgi:radical SAM superfamily enzyme YgiQ (UPF0313 family)
MNISIVSTNREKAPDALIPNGPACVAAWLREQGHQVQILDLCFSPNIEQAITTHLKSYAPQLVGVSIRHTENNELFYLRSFLQYEKSAVDIVKKQSGAKILLGGAAFTLFPQELLNYLDVPYGLAGDGENAFSLFIQYLEGKRDPSSLPGICYWDKGKAVANPIAKVRDFKGLPFPAYDLLDLQRYLAEGSAMPIEGKRGCDLVCSFCPEGADEEGGRLRPPKMVVDEMEFMAKRFGAKRFFFSDGLFSFPAEHAIEICQELIERKLNISWGAGINPIGLSREMVQAMKGAGCGSLALGIDAASEKMLKSYRKGFNKGDITRAAKLLSEVEIPHAYYILFGGPEENSETVQETIDFLQGFAQPIFLRAGIRIFKGTELERQAKEEGVLEEGHDMLSPTYYLSKELGDDFMRSLDSYCEGRGNWFTINKLVKRGLAPRRHGDEKPLLPI